MIFNIEVEIDILLNVKMLKSKKLRINFSQRRKVTQSFAIIIRGLSEKFLFFQSKFALALIFYRVNHFH